MKGKQERCEHALNTMKVENGKEKWTERKNYVCIKRGRRGSVCMCVCVCWGGCVTGRRGGVRVCMCVYVYWGSLRVLMYREFLFPVSLWRYETLPGVFIKIIKFR